MVPARRRLARTHRRIDCTSLLGAVGIRVAFTVARVAQSPLNKEVRMRRLFLLCAATSSLAACATAGHVPAPVSSTNHRVIGAAELAKLSGSTAYDAILRLRSTLPFSSVAANASPGLAPPEVYMDNVRFGSLVLLQSVPINSVQEIRFVSGIEASTRFGSGHTGGIIEIIMKQGGQ
jgi:hypothetical protein